MSKITIPEKVMPGFNVISGLSNKDTSALSTYLQNLPFGIDFDNIVTDLGVLLNLEDPKSLFNAILSFAGLLESYGNDFDELAKDLAESYKIETKDTQVKESLIKNLVSIFNNFSNLNLNIKTRNLTYDNPFILTESKIITDIRIVFQDDISSKERAAIILQKLHIEYQNGDTNKEIFLTMDVEDLKKMKIQIERAINEESILREDYKNLFKFI